MSGLRAHVMLTRGGFTMDAAIDAPAGRTVALLGPNGAGKSTLVGAIAGIVPTDDASVTLDGRVLDGPNGHLAAERRPVGVVFQDLRLFPHLSALENVAFPLRARRIDRATAELRSGALLARLGVAHRAHARPGELSGGEAQRVALARALVHEPAVLLLDEPFSGVDVQARTAIRSILRRELTAFGGVRIIVTHDPVEAMTLGDLLVVMESGRVTQAGTPDEIRSAPCTPYAAAVAGLNLFRGRLEPLESGTGLLRTSDGDVVVPWPAGMAGPVSDVLGLLRPADVALYRARPDGSARNVIPGRIEAVTMEPDRARIRIDARPPLVAELTTGSVTRLGLAEGVEVWSSFKAMEVTVVVP